MNDRWQKLSLGAAWIWLGGSLCLSFIVAPALFSAELRTAMTKEQAGMAAQLVLKKHFFFQCACAALMGIGILAQRQRNAGTYCWALATILILVGGLWLTPKLTALHQQMQPLLYGLPASALPAEQFKSAFGKWHGVAQLANLAVMAIVGGWLFLSGRDAKQGGPAIKPSSVVPEPDAHGRA